MLLGEEMNIFVLDLDPQKAAEYHCNKHVVKMILECGQMLCASHWMHLLKNHYKGQITDFKRVRDLQNWLLENTPHEEQPPWKLSHVRHPCTAWTNQSLGNYTWHWNLGMSLCKEYTARYDKKVHKSETVLKWLGDNQPKFNKTEMTPFSICMKEEYKVENDPVQSYRNYYIQDKVRFAKWEPRSTMPQWFKRGINA